MHVVDREVSARASRSPLGSSILAPRFNGGRCVTDATCNDLSEVEPPKVTCASDTIRDAANLCNKLI